MIIAKLMGGLGNQMFQYGLGRHLSSINNTELLLDIDEFQTYKLHKYSLSAFNIKAPIADEHDLLKVETKTLNIKKLLYKIARKKMTPRFKEPHFQFYPDIFNFPGDLYLDGYWQSEKYFLPIRDTLLEDFQVTEPQKGRDLELANIITGSNSVSLHIRRTDYVTNELTKKIHGTCGLDYYEKSIAEISSKVTDPYFFVFSDDHKWAKANLILSHSVIFVDHNDASKNYEDLRLMSQCKHHIIANSTFSWWGAWLNPNKSKIVIAPKIWFNTTKNDTSDLIPGDWMRL